jgi:hypothetical protein
MERLADTASPAKPVAKPAKAAPINTPEDDGPTMEEMPDGIPF